jgi:hypothetical protein
MAILLKTKKKSGIHWKLVSWQVVTDGEVRGADISTTQLIVDMPRFVLDTAHENVADSRFANAASATLLNQ